MLPQPICLLNLVLTFFRMIIVQERQFYLCDLIKHTFNIGPHLNTCEPICFERERQRGARGVREIKRDRQTETDDRNRRHVVKQRDRQTDRPRQWAA